MFPLIDLEKIDKRREFSQSSIFNYGLFLGFMIVTMLIVILFFIHFKVIYDDVFVNKLWPIFRGTFLINCYTWFIALNIIVWERYNVNYKVYNIISTFLIFKFIIRKKKSIFKGLLYSQLFGYFYFF